MLPTLRATAVSLVCLMSLLVSAGPAAAQASATACDDTTHVHPGEPWASRGGGTGVGFRVWAHCDGNEQKDMASVASMIDSFWAEMTRYMGEPLRDPGGWAFGGDPAVDFYLTVPVRTCDTSVRTNCVPPGAGSRFNYCSVSGVPQRDYTCQFIEAGSTLAQTQADRVSSPPHGASAFVLVDRTMLNEPTARGTLVHEFFHVLQYRYNRDYTTKALTANGQNVRNWFVESTATWAEARFNPSTRAELHAHYFPSWVEEGRPLDTKDPPRAAYGAYLWPFFMEQQAAGSVAAVWKALAGVPVSSDEAMLETIAKIVSLEQHFRTFSLRNLNQSYDGAVTPLYSAADATFPKTASMESVMEVKGPVLHGQKRGVPPIEYHPKVLALQAVYYHFRVGIDVQQLTLDAAGLTPRAALDVDVLLKIRNKTWVLRPVKGNVRFCRNDPTDDVEELIVVLSNHSTTHQDVAGTLGVTPQVDGCPAPPATLDVQYVWAVTQAYDNGAASASHETKEMRLDAKAAMDLSAITAVGGPAQEFTIDFADARLAGPGMGTSRLLSLNGTAGYSYDREAWFDTTMGRCTESAFEKGSGPIATKDASFRVTFDGTGIKTFSMSSNPFTVTATSTFSPCPANNSPGGKTTDPPAEMNVSVDFSAEIEKQDSDWSVTSSRTSNGYLIQAKYLKTDANTPANKAETRQVLVIRLETGDGSKR